MAATLNADELLALVDALADGAWHSGERLAERARITRAAVAKRVAKLAAWGLDVEAQIGRGYRLSQPIERLDAATIRRSLPAAARQKLRAIEVVAVIDSTNQRLMDAGSADDPRVLLAEHQTAGRGRRGRGWHSPFGANLYLSAAWSFAHWPAQLTVLPITVGVACARALAALGVSGVALKWPNDLIADGRKLGGILIEQRGEAGGACRAVIGVGLNVSMRRAQNLHRGDRGIDRPRTDQSRIDQPWTSVAELGQSPSRNALAAELIAQLALALGQFTTAGFKPFAAEWQRLDLTRDRPVRVQAGKDSCEGIARGLDETGALRIETATGTRAVLAGDVSLRVK